MTDFSEAYDWFIRRFGNVAGYYDDDEISRLIWAEFNNDQARAGVEALVMERYGDRIGTDLPVAPERERVPRYPDGSVEAMREKARRSEKLMFVQGYKTRTGKYVPPRIQTKPTESRAWKLWNEARRDPNLIYVKASKGRRAYVRRRSKK